MRLRPASAAFLVALLAGSASSGCGGTRPEARFGQRAGDTDDGRETVLLAAPADSAGFLVFPAIIDSVAVRPERAVLAPGEATAVEVLVKGALPDACAEMASATQSRLGHYVTITLDMRTPRDQVCAAVARPYRFYLPLDGTYDAGSYVLTLNGAVHPFQIRERAGRE